MFVLASDLNDSTLMFGGRPATDIDLPEASCLPPSVLINVNCGSEPCLLNTRFQLRQILIFKILYSLGEKYNRFLKCVNNYWTHLRKNDLF